MAKNLNFVVYIYVTILFIIFRFFGIPRIAQKMEKKALEAKAKKAQ